MSCPTCFCSTPTPRVVHVLYGMKGIVVGEDEEGHPIRRIIRDETDRWEQLCRCSCHPEGATLRPLPDPPEGAA